MITAVTTTTKGDEYVLTVSYSDGPDSVFIGSAEACERNRQYALGLQATVRETYSHRITRLYGTHRVFMADVNVLPFMSCNACGDDVEIDEWIEVNADGDHVSCDRK